jgi:protein involved in polysaccharide export with SLBB domain
MRLLRNKPLWLTIFCLLSFTAAVPRSSFGAPAEKQFNSDMAYYRRSVKQKKMTANDRLYILGQLRNKYKDADFDLTDLYTEIDRSTALKEKEPAQEPSAQEPADNEEPLAAPAPDKTQKSSLIKAVVVDNKIFSRLTLIFSAVPEYKEILKKDEQGKQPPVIVFYLFNTRSQLKKIARDFKIKKGIIRQVQSASAAAKPPTVRVSVSLRADKPYTVKAEGNKLVLTVLKVDPDSPAPAPAGAAAPTALPQTADFEQEPPGTVSSPTISVSNKMVSVPQTGDIVNVQISPVKELSRQMLIEGEGATPFYPLDPLQFQGIETEKTAKEIAQKLSEYIPNAQAAVTAEHPEPDRIHLIGRAKNPGSYEYVKGSKCHDWIVKIGGLLQDADGKHIRIHRSVQGHLQVIEFDADALAVSQDPSKDVLLAKGDIVEIREKPEYILVLGAVKTPGQFPLVPECKVREALAAAGEWSEPSAPRTFDLIRTEGSKKITQKLSVRRLMEGESDTNLLLKPGDILFVPPAAASAQKNFMSSRLAPWIAFFGSLALVVGFLI